MKLPGRGDGARHTSKHRAVELPSRRVGRSTPGRPREVEATGRGSGRGRRLPRPSRLPRLTPGRAGALLGILGSLGAIYGLAASPAFSFSRAEIPELRWTTRTAIEAAIGIPEGTNLFRLSVRPLEARIRGLPGIAGASVAVSLPDTLVVHVREREPILVWAVTDRAFLVDRDGVLFATTDPASAAAAELTVINDSRSESARLVVGGRLDPIDLDAARRLGSLVPSDVGSSATRLVVTVSEANGFVVGTFPASWVAIFGGYTPTQRTTELIPGQVRLLRSLLAGQESLIAEVILADDTEGTYILKATPEPSS